MIPGLSNKKPFSKLTEQQILALAIGAEEEDAKIYAMYAERLRKDYPQSAKVFDAMTKEENEHRRRLIEVHRARFGETIPLVRRDDVSGFFRRKPIWLIESLGIERIREEAALMESQARNFYLKAAERTTDADTRKLLGDLAAEEASHITSANRLEQKHLDSEALDQEAKTARLEFILTYVQPGLAGLMDGSVSTLAPVFAAAFATHNPKDTFLVGLAASIGAGISMGLTEALADDGVLSGRGSPTKRGIVCGLMTALGGLGHALPYLIPDFWTATIVAMILVAIELWAIAWIQNRYMDTPFFRAALQVIVGGSLVFATGILIGNSRKGCPHACFHNHTFHSDGSFGPAEMVRRALSKGLSVIALTDHADGANLEQMTGLAVRAARELNGHWPITVIPGCEITHAPAETIAELVSRARRAGAKIVIVHGETSIEPVEKGTNAAAVEAGADILAHPGFLDLRTMLRSLETGTAIELSLREKQFEGNRHILSLAREQGLLEKLKFVINSDAHEDEQIKSEELIALFDEECIQGVLSEEEAEMFYETVEASTEEIFRSASKQGSNRISLLNTGPLA